jgi:hypothetical protein
VNCTTSLGAGASTGAASSTRNPPPSARAKPANARQRRVAVAAAALTGALLAPVLVAWIGLAATLNVFSAAALATAPASYRDGHGRSS